MPGSPRDDGLLIKIMRTGLFITKLPSWNSISRWRALSCLHDKYEEWKCENKLQGIQLQFSRLCLQCHFQIISLIHCRGFFLFTNRTGCLPVTSVGTQPLRVIYVTGPVTFYVVVTTCQVQLYLM